jgi:hypothetical protein
VKTKMNHEIVRSLKEAVGCADKKARMRIERELAEAQIEFIAEKLGLKVQRFAPQKYILYNDDYRGEFGLRDIDELYGLLTDSSIPRDVMEMRRNAILRGRALWKVEDLLFPSEDKHPQPQNTAEEKKD